MFSVCIVTRGDVGARACMGRNVHKSQFHEF